MILHKHVSHRQLLTLPCMILRNFVRSLCLLKDKAFINGEWVDAVSKKTFEINNPFDNSVIGSVPDMDSTDTQCAIDAAYCAFRTWRNTTAKQKSIVLRRWYELLEECKQELASIVTEESGKPLSESVTEVNYGNAYVEFYAEEAKRIYGEIIPSPWANKKVLIEKYPIGVVGLITPWNFPHALLARKASAALAAGCTCVIKPSELTPLTALAMVDLAKEAGFPKGVINIITMGSKNTSVCGRLICESKLVAGVSFTGSTRVGRLLMQQCSQGLKRLILELGGNTPFIVFESANIDEAVEGAMASKFLNSGQTCISSNRFFVHYQIFDEFIDKFSGRMKNITLGDGRKSGVTAGPLINERQFKKVADLVDDALTQGAKVVIGGRPAVDVGSLFYQPTLMVKINKNMRILKEEIFGPIAAINKFSNEEDVLGIANCTDSGLAGYFYSRDINQIFRVAKLLDVGMIGINEGIISASEVPCGGIKESGFGREGSRHGVDEYVYYKYMCIGNI